MSKWRQTPHQKLLRAYERGSGVKLSAADVFSLVAMDTAIKDAALRDDEDQVEIVGFSDDEEGQVSKST